MNYFSNCYTIHDAKKRFRELTKIHHPDAGGDSKTMAEVIRQYDIFVPSRQPHDNNFKSTFSYGRTYSPPPNQPPPRSSSSFQGNIPFDHPIMVELRELRNKFPYALEEENKQMKKILNEQSLGIFALRKEIEKLQEQIKKLKDKKKVKKSSTASTTSKRKLKRGSQPNLDVIYL